MTRIVRLHEFGAPEVLHIENVDLPALGQQDVRIRVKALGLNRAEALFRSGTYIETPALPSGLGLEAAGIVEAIGEGVRDFALGDIVSVVPPVSMARWPAYGEAAIFPARLLVKHPPSLGWVEAAALWMQYLTAYGALIDIAQLRKDDFLVITAASSSVGLAAIQIGNMVGANTIAVTRTSAKKDALLEHGAQHVIISDEEDLEQKLKEISGSSGIRVVFDAVGGPMFEAFTGSMSEGGILIEYGGLSKEPTPFPLFNVLSRRLTLRGYLVHEVITDDKKLADAKRFILAGLESGELKPVIDRTFPFENIVEAHRFLESNQQFGKIVVTI
ncbi:zinc-dependent alcohol dehydrogenase family protein [Phyllobacterium sp. YR531]|uniref:zinc-dependent alcohol dehydrogenase family protein n=1 Tax=Phyllobacterium sp. YR531 TaxID=1144343 RepID=UPI00026F7DED|nr:zinc-dependent alcohol dehydrogenase family protein [Phyllobacterium sp. YR531]EJN06318.1 Zn-dependent oxidoreductase, NADPH:quinone reductase [Phyllobacterium sp. YR531]